jgi:hypothetical protein
MFIRLHHAKNGKPFYIPATHIVIIDGVDQPVTGGDKILSTEGELKRTTPVTMVHSIITKGSHTLTFEVKEPPEEVAALVNMAIEQLGNRDGDRSGDGAGKGLTGFDR